MQSAELQSVSYQLLNGIGVWSMLIVLIYAKVFTKNVNRNMSRFLTLMGCLYSVGLICDSIAQYNEITGWRFLVDAVGLACIQLFCIISSATSWFLYVLTTTFPATKRNLKIYVAASIPMALVISYFVAYAISGGIVLGADGTVWYDEKICTVTVVTTILYYLAATVVGHANLCFKKKRTKEDSFIRVYSVPIIISLIIQMNTSTNFYVVGITTSYCVYILALNYLEDSEHRKELIHFSNIMDSLKNQYSSILYANLVENQLEAYMINSKTGKKKDDLINDYDRFMQDYVEHVVYSSDRDLFLENIDRNTVRHELERDSKKEFEFRIVSNGEIIHMKLVIWRAKADIAIEHAVLGFQDITAEKQSISSQEKTDSIIHGLMHGFEYVCYLNYANADFEEYHASNNFECFFDIVGAKPGFDRFVSLFKHGMTQEDYKDFRVRFDADTIQEALMEFGVFTMDCCLNLGNGYKYYNIKAIGDGHNPEIALFGVSDIDEQIRRELEKEERAKEKEYSVQLETTIAERTAELHEKAKTLNQINEEITELLGNITEARDMESGEHIKRVKGYTRILANHIKQDWPEYGLDDEQIALITSASALHDIGKIMISDAILRKPGKFTPEEFNIMKSHTSKGCEMLEMAPKGWDKRYLDFSMEICKYHHEKWDGKGYPEGLTGDDIPISAQIVSVADCFDALTTKRVYKDAYEPQEAFDMILSGQCGQFSDKMLESLQNSREEFFAHMNDISEVGSVTNAISASASLSDVSILLIEDNELTSMITTEILQDEGATVKSVSLGQEVIDYLEKTGRIEFDVILMDLELPDMDGFELTRKIRSLDIGRAKVAPIIAVSSNTDKIEMQRAMNAGMNAYIPKPVTVANITKTLLACMRYEQKYLSTKLDEAIMRANKDPLTGVKNMTAYTEAVGEITKQIAEHTDIEFAIVMCDVNKLKEINDKYGHDMGDKYIRNCCKLICTTYDHSPVYRIGGDEFAVILTGNDYENRNSLIDSIGERINNAVKIDRIEDGRASLAVGMSVYNPYTDVSVASVSKRADESMYNNKHMMQFGGNY